MKRTRIILTLIFFGILSSGFVSCSSNEDNGGNKPIPTEPDSGLPPQLTDNELMDKVQEQTFKYFWDFGHPISGMARERSDASAYGGESPNIVTSGGSGFGVMAIIVGVERNYISREEALVRLNKIADFILNGDRFHGALPHWYNGNTGKVRPFFTEDNGGDLVETSFMIQGLLAARQYFDLDNSEENGLRDKINLIWDQVEWDWYTNNRKSLTWHWSPEYGFTINHQIKGYNEALITYVLAASSRSHAIDSDVYHNGWASGNDFINGKLYYQKWQLRLGPDYGGPLFFSHYSFLGLNPEGLIDNYANYWDQNVNHTLINREYCTRNPKGFMGYGATNWGLTASDDNEGYGAHSPTNDNGTITPTAALSSMPYAPEESLQALRNFYYNFNGKLWGQYGFYDAFNKSANWYSNQYLAIDQGPIIVMIENYRTGLLWDLFMSCPEVKQGLTKLGFTSPNI
jgi:hypothetical protein